MTHPQVLSFPAWSVAQTCPRSALTNRSPSVLSLTYVAYSTPFFLDCAECARMGPGKNHSHNNTFLFLYVIFLITYFGKNEPGRETDHAQNPRDPDQLTRSRGAYVSCMIFTRRDESSRSSAASPVLGCARPFRTRKAFTKQVSRKRFNEPYASWCGERGTTRTRTPR